MGKTDSRENPTDLLNMAALILGIVAVWNYLGWYALIQAPVIALARLYLNGKRTDAGTAVAVTGISVMKMAVRSIVLWYPAAYLLLSGDTVFPLLHGLTGGVALGMISEVMISEAMLGNG